MKTILRYFYTIIHLRPIQIYYRIFYKIRLVFRKNIGFQYPQFVSAPSYSITLKPSIISNQSYFPDENRFCLLNQAQVFPINQINWNDEKTYGKLWAYNLNYFDFLNQENLTKSQGISLIRAFINASPPLKTGLEAYPMSLRGINWIKFLNKYQIQDDEINAFLLAQYFRLADNIEYHIMGNHLLENAFSLLFGAYYFQNEQFLKVANQIFEQEFSEQILADGGHFERSPMYHQIILFRMLDCLNLIQNNNNFHGLQIEKSILEYAQKMLDFLQIITFKNGDIPLMNDAAKNVAPTTLQILQYAHRLNLHVQKIDLSESNYRKIEHNNYELLINVGEVSPNYLPAHSHSDIFNFVLYVNGKPFIVDTGTSTYENTTQRQVERSTSAHNTVQIGDFEQSEIWESFRIARRAKCRILSESESQITASHNGFQRLGVIHERSFTTNETRILIEDKIVGKTKYTQKAYLHFHPTIDIEIIGSRVKTNTGELIFSPEVEIVEGEYYFIEEFNKKVKSKVITLFFENYLSTTLKFFNHLENPCSNILL